MSKFWKNTVRSAVAVAAMVFASPAISAPELDEGTLVANELDPLQIGDSVEVIVYLKDGPAAKKINLGTSVYDAANLNKDSSVVKVTSSNTSNIIAAGESDGSFTIQALSSGTAHIRVWTDTAQSDYLDIPVTVRPLDSPLVTNELDPLQIGDEIEIIVYLKDGATTKKVNIGTSVYDADNAKKDASVVKITSSTTSQVIPAGAEDGSFTIKALASGSAHIRVWLNIDQANYLDIPVKVLGSRATAAMVGDADVTSVELGEGDVAKVYLRVEDPPKDDTVFNVSVSGGDPSGRLTYTTSVTVPANGGKSLNPVTLTAVSGPFDGQFTLMSPSGLYDPAVFAVSVTNKAPKLLAPVYKDPEKIPESSIQKTIKGMELVFTASASDVAADVPNLKYIWSFGDGTTVTDASGATSSSVKHSWTQQNTYTVSVYATDGSGNSEVGYILVEVGEAATLYTSSESPFMGLASRGGIAQNTGFAVVSPAGYTWSPDGTSFLPNESVKLAALLEAGSYPFGWYGEEDVLTGTLATRVPSDKTTTTVQLPDSGGANVTYLASYPYYTTIPDKGALLNSVYADPFGDFDGDGLSDAWEDLYFTAGCGVEALSINTTSLPVGIGVGEPYGATGNMDLDFLPTSVYETAPDNNPPKKVVYGWPVADDADPGRTNRVLVYKYPLDFTSGGQSYNNVYGNKPAFENFTEYRGLKEDFSDDPGADMDNFVAVAPKTVTDKNKGERGDCPATDPTMYDTDGDGLPDGWEYYFWTTAKYGVHSENWRAYDPYFTLYTSEKGKTGTAGIPLLADDRPVEILYEQDPSHGYFISIADDTYDTRYVPDGKDAKAALADGLPMVRGTFLAKFAEADPEFYLFTKEDEFDFNGSQPVFYPVLVDLDGDGALEPAVEYNEKEDTYLPVCKKLEGAYVNCLTGDFFIPGWNRLIYIAGAEALTQESKLSVSWIRLNGMCSREFIMSKFDPMNWTKGTAPDVKAFGYDPKAWDIASDLDGDGVSDIEEYFLGTDPLHWDTDRDGMPDGWEVLNGLNPISPEDGDGTGPNDNPDEDYMAGSGDVVHALNYLAEGFVPGNAALPTDGFGPVPNFSNIQEFRVAQFGLACFTDGKWASFRGKGIYPKDWAAATTNPCDNDTNGDGVPDGWELYVGVDPISGDVQPGLIGLPLDLKDFDMDMLSLAEEFSCTEATNHWPETKTIYIGGGVKRASGAAPGSAGASGDGETVVAEDGAPASGTPVTIRAFPPLHADWTNKKLPTDPWNADTDGDGLGDWAEYTSDIDSNLDGSLIVNLDPCSVDTDLDWLPDNWEFAFGTCWPDQTTKGVSLDDPWGPYGDPDGDGLPNYQEYLTAANYGWRWDKWYNRGNTLIWMPQKRARYANGIDPDFPYDPGVDLESGPVVRAHEYDMMDFFRPAVPDYVIENGVAAIRALERRWGYTMAESPSIGQETLAAFFQRAHEIVTDEENFRQWIDPDAEAALFGYSPPVYATDMFHFDGKDYWTTKTGESLTQDEFYDIVMFYENAQNYLYSYGAAPRAWDPAAHNTPHGGPFTFIASVCGTSPRSTDTDNDGMPDYWEIYHGLNPLYGGSRSVGARAGEIPDSDKATDGSDNWEMGNDPRYVRIMGPCLVNGTAPQMRAPHTWNDPENEDASPRSWGDGETSHFPCVCGYHVEAAHYDLVNRPWLSGDKSADCDKDGLDNQEEAYAFVAPSMLSHTDPSPYWMTDVTDPESHANLYYGPGSIGASQWWWWEYPIDENGMCNMPPTYIWDFEVNEGYDTDNDNISDREELSETNARGSTDPIDLDSPISRKAMFFDGRAATRTQRPFFHDYFSLTSFTVELWARVKDLPAPGKTATLIQRPVLMPVDHISGTPGWAVRNNFLVYIDEAGAIHVRVDNDGIDQPANQAVLASAGRVAPGVWTHIAVVMDSVNNTLDLYINGERTERTQTGIKPCTGTLLSSSYSAWESANGVKAGYQVVANQVVNFDYSPAPIVLGASDGNPWGVVGGAFNGISEPSLDKNTYFSGWIDEVRIWDRCRTRTEIFNNMGRRFTKADVEAVNRKRWLWDQLNLQRADATFDFPQKLLYLYSFDNLPDVVRDPSRGGAFDEINSTDTAPVPAGWSETAAVRPRGFIPWWYFSPWRSTVYSTDYSFVHFIENTAAHMPQHPPRDVGELMPVYDPYTLDFAGYRYRQSQDWIMEVADVITPAVLSSVTNGVIVRAEDSIVRNTMDPYGDAYATSVNSIFEAYPWNFGGRLDAYGIYEDMPVRSDMVPLLDAVADMDVPMWDGAGAGWDYSQLDSDGDGLPDWWEIANGLDPSDGDGGNGARGDQDCDGLDNYGEYLAGTDPQKSDTDSDGYSDYYSRAGGASLTYGELYDDSDGMDNSWEVDHGLDPERYDADLDPDGDGWTNYEEFMARTDPNDSGSFPIPQFNVTFDYFGEQYDAKQLFVYAYGEKTAGTGMGGECDGKYSMTTRAVGGGGVIGEEGEYRSQGEIFYSSKLPQSFISSATITVYTNGTLESGVQFTSSFFNDEIDLLSRTPEGYLFVAKESGRLLAVGEFVGMPYTIDLLESDAFAFPATYHGMIRKGGSRRTHMVSGNNRFFGFMDVNGNEEFDIGEPAGLAIPNPTIVNWDSVDIEIPLTDELFGFPRISWPASTNENVRGYRVVITRGNTALPKSIYVAAPRTFMHEGDYINAGINGLDFGATTGAEFDFEVQEDDGFGYTAVTNIYVAQHLVSSTSPRRETALVNSSPRQKSKVYGSTVEFAWTMDPRSEGVLITLTNTDTGKKYFDRKYIPFPVRHGKASDDNHYYTCTPQIAEGDRFTALPSGNYTYTITPVVNSSKVTAGSVSESFQLVNDSSDISHHSIKGVVKYYGKVMEDSRIDSAAFDACDGVATTITGSVDPAAIHAGAVSVRLVTAGGKTVDSLNDSAANGILCAESSPDAYNGLVSYETGAITVVFKRAPEAGMKLELYEKRFPVQLVIQAFKLSDDATTCTAPSGAICAEVRQTRKGAFEVPGLADGKYAVRAFLDSNANGACDDWETQGVCVMSGTITPVVDSGASALSINGVDLFGTTIVLHDRDTDNDLLPDAWEFQNFKGSVSKGSMTDSAYAAAVIKYRSGYDQSSPGEYTWLSYADGALDADPRTPDTDLDGLTDAMEILVTHTDTHMSDTDGDGVGDLEEFLAGSDPADSLDAKRYTTPALEFDADGVPFVDCAYPSLKPGVVLVYTLQRKSALEAAWEDVCEVSVGATNGVAAYRTDGLVSYDSEPGVARMKPADLVSSDDVDWTAGFFRVKVTADYGLLEDNGDGTWSYWTWVNLGDNSWKFQEAARGAGVLRHAASGEWSFISEDEAAEAGSGTLLRKAGSKEWEYRR